MERTTGRRRRSTALAASGLLVGSLAAAAVLAPTAAQATPVARQVRVANTDWTAAGVGGVGSASDGGGTGDIMISGVSGTVTGAYLTWNGIGPNTGTVDAPNFVGPYDNPDITVNGAAVVGTSEGESGSNCWGGNTSSRTYLADVTSLVTGNGTYALAGLGDGGDANGANLVVTYDDGNASNNRDLYLYYGNDTDADGFPGEDMVWSDPLTDINYQAGEANLLLGVADGQDFGNPDDGDLSVTGNAGPLDFADTPENHGLWDGTTVPDAGHSRAPNGSLYDLESFDVTGALGDPGVQSLTIDSALMNDCHSLNMVAVDVQATGNQPPPPESVSVAPASRVEGTAPLPRGNVTRMAFKVTLSAPSASPVTVTLHTEDNTAIAPDDYLSRTQTVTIAPGKIAVKFRVRVVPDNSVEGNETFYAVIDSASVPVATNAAIGTIVDDDSAAPARRAASVRNATGGGAR